MCQNYKPCTIYGKAFTGWWKIEQELPFQLVPIGFVASPFGKFHGFFFFYIVSNVL